MAHQRPAARRGLRRDVFHEWIDIFVRHQQDRERAGLPHDLLEADHWAGFWATMPQVQVAISIKTRYHRNSRRTWKSNDIADIDAMSIAYPCCDAVLTDQEARTAMKDSPDLRPIGTYLPKGPLEPTSKSSTHSLWAPDCRQDGRICLCPARRRRWRARSCR